MAYEKSKDHSKQTLSKTIQKKKESGGELGEKYSVQSMRDNMSTGGGQPIPKGQKWNPAVQKRVKQPRDPETGQFAYNADADIELKFKSRGKTIPIAARRLGINENAFKNQGSKIAIDGKVWASIGGEQIDKDAVIDQFRHYNEEANDYISEKGGAFSSEYQRKRGRTSTAEKEQMASGQFVLSSINLTSVNFDKSKQAFANKKYAQTNMNAKAFQSKPNLYKGDSAQPKQEPKPQPEQKPEPKPEAPKQEEQPKQEEGVDYSQGAENPSEFYKANKEKIDAEMNEFNKMTGMNVSAEDFIQIMNNYNK